MATFNGGRMVALFLCLLFALNVSFAQDPVYETYVLYMVDPVEEQLAPEVYDYIEKWNDPLTWETFEDDFAPARQAQVDAVSAENDLRIQKAYEILSDRKDCADGTCIKSWVPSWIPLKRAGNLEEAHTRDEDDPDENAKNFLFKNILGLTGAEGQTLEEFYDENWNASEPDSESESGVRNCVLGERCEQAKLLSSYFQSLVTAQREQGARIISLTFRASRTVSEEDPDPELTDSFVEELETGSTQKPGEDPPRIVTREVLVEEGSVRLLQPAKHDPNLRVIDDPSDGYFRPAAKPIAEISSWGRIKATLAD